MKSFIFVTIFSFCLCAVVNAQTSIQDTTSDQKQTVTSKNETRLSEKVKEARLQRRAQNKTNRHFARNQNRRDSFERMRNWKARINKHSEKSSD